MFTRFVLKISSVSVAYILLISNAFSAEQPNFSTTDVEVRVENGLNNVQPFENTFEEIVPLVADACESLDEYSAVNGNEAGILWEDGPMLDGEGHFLHQDGPMREGEVDLPPEHGSPLENEDTFLHEDGPFLGGGD